MHRSGTSLVARVLNLLGVYLGPVKKMMRPGPDNPAGFWEHLGIYEINEEILRLLGGTWDALPELPPLWEERPELAPLYSRAKRMISSDFRGQALWGWKDPRNAILLPFWRKVQPSLRFVISFRNPLDVASSLSRRNAFPTSKGVRLWALYTATAILNTRGAPRLVSAYENYFDDWRREVARLSRFLGIGQVRINQAAKQIESFIQEELWHHRSSVRTVLSMTELEPAAQALYISLLQEIRGEANEPNRALGQLQLDTVSALAWHDLGQVEGIQKLTAELHQAEKGLEERTRWAQSLDAELAERRAYLAKLQAEFDEKAAWADQLNAQVQALEQTSREQQAEASRFRTEFEDQQSYLASLQRELEDKQELEKQLTTLEQDLSTKQARIDELTWLWQMGTARKRRFCLSLLAPLDWGIGTLLLLAEALSRVVRRFAPKQAPSMPPPDIRRCSIVVLSWEGKDLLAESLPPLLEAVRRHGGDHEIIVVDNGSTDGTSDYVQTHFPSVRLVRSERNIYYTGGNNLGVQAATRDIVVLLNNDMIVDPNFLDPLLKGFDQPDVFAVSSQVFFADPNKRREETGKTRARFNGCDLDWSHDSILSSDEQRGYVPVFWAHGGAAAFDRRKFRWLGGLDTLYDPFYVEDADLSYRAWKVGWSCLLAVHSHVLHKHRATNSPRYGEPFVARIVRRNQHLFIWKNFTDLRKLAAHFSRAIGRRIQRAGIPGVGIRFEAGSYLRAVTKVPHVLWRRLTTQRSFVRSDAEVLEAISTPPKEAIVNSEVDFRSGSFQEYLGDGWYELEDPHGHPFRWMAKNAFVFLRAPAESAELCIEGYVSSLNLYGSRRVFLTVSCRNERQTVRLNEGTFCVRQMLTGLNPETPLRVGLFVNRTITGGEDKRLRSIIVRRVALRVLGPTNQSVTTNRTQVRERAQGDSEVLHAALESSASSQARGRRILFVCAYLPCEGVHAGGGRMFNVIKRLSKEYRITVLSFVETDEDYQRVPALAELCEHIEVVRRGQSLTARNILRTLPPQIVYEFYNPRMQEMVHSYLRDGHFDLLQCEYLQTGHLAPKRVAIPALLTHMEVLSLAHHRDFSRSALFSQRKWQAFVDWMRMINYEADIFERFAGIIVLTDEEKQFLEKYLPGRSVFVHPTGVDCAYFSPNGVAEHSSTVTFVGYFRHQPNVFGAKWFAERVMPEVLRRCPDAKLQLVGGSPPPEFQLLAQSKHVLVTGWVPDIRPYLERSAVVIAPLHTGAGFRGKILEAWAMEKPVVATSLARTGIPFVDGRVGFIADDVGTFADRVCRLLEDRELAQQMGREGRKVVENSFSWDVLAEKHKQIYEEVLHSGG